MSERKVERETVVEAEPERVWEALTDDDLLSDWFADDAELDPVEGGDVSFGSGEKERRGTVERVEEERELSFTWSRSGEGESLVTFRLEPLEVGTRILVVEEALAPPAITALSASAWDGAIARLHRCLGALLPA